MLMILALPGFSFFSFLQLLGCSTAITPHLDKDLLDPKACTYSPAAGG
jgi:hypothetical protein